VLLNYSTAHNIAPNISPFIRYTVYFRITTTSATTQRRNNHLLNSSASASSSPMSTMAAIPSSTPMRHRPEARNRLLNTTKDQVLGFLLEHIPNLRIPDIQGPPALAIRPSPSAMLSVWSDWKGLQRMSLPFSDDDGGGVIALDRRERARGEAAQGGGRALGTILSLNFF
jgi:hypothetical protein